MTSLRVFPKNRKKRNLEGLNYHNV